MSEGHPGAAVSTQALGRFGAQAEIHLRAGIERSRQPMLICDDQRRWVTGNDAGRELLSSSAQDLPWRTMDEFTPASGRRRLDEQWQAFLTGGGAEGWYELCLSDRTVQVEFSGLAHVVPSRHLMIFIPLDEDADAAGSADRRPPWSATPPASDRLQLTQREREVITLIAGGAQSPEVAERLFLSPETIKTHAHNAMIKLGAHTRAHAVAIALVTGQVVWSMHEPPPTPTGA